MIKKMNLSKKRMLDDNRRKQWEIQKAAFDARISEMKSGDPKTRDDESRDNNNTRDGTDTVIPIEAPEHQKSEMMWFQSENEEHTKEMHQSSREQSVVSHDQSNQLTLSKIRAESQQPEILEVPELPPKLKFMLDMMEKNGKLTPEKKAFFMKMVAKKRAQEVRVDNKPPEEAVKNSVAERNSNLEKEATKNTLAELIAKRRLQANSPTSSMTAPSTAAPSPQATMTPETNLSAKALLLQRLAAKRKVEKETENASASKVTIESSTPMATVPSAAPSPHVTMTPETNMSAKALLLQRLTAKRKAEKEAESASAQKVTIEPSALKTAATTTKPAAKSTIVTTESDPRADFFARFKKQTTTAVPIIAKTLSTQTTSDPRAAFFARFNKPTTTALPLTVSSETTGISDPRAAFLSKIAAKNDESKPPTPLATEEKTDLTPEEKAHLAKKEFFRKKMAKKAAAAAAVTKSPMTASSSLPSKPSGPPTSFLANMTPEKREFFMKMMAKKRSMTQLASASGVKPTHSIPIPVVHDGPTLMEKLRAKMASKALLSTTAIPPPAPPTDSSDDERDETIEVNSRNLLMQKLAEKKMLEMNQEPEVLLTTPSATTVLITVKTSMQTTSDPRAAFFARFNKPATTPPKVPSPSSQTMITPISTSRPSTSKPMQIKKPNSRSERRERKQKRKLSNQVVPTAVGRSEPDSDTNSPDIDPSNDELDARKAFMLKMLDKSSSQLAMDTSNQVGDSVLPNDKSLDAKKAFFQRMMAAKSQESQTITAPLIESNQPDPKANLMTKLNKMRVEFESAVAPVDIASSSTDSPDGIVDDKKAFFLKMLAKKRGRRASHHKRHRREHLYWQPINALGMHNGI